MKELESLYNRLQCSNILLMKEAGDSLECSFLNTGIVQHTLRVQDKLLAAELWRAGDNGILEGAKYHAFLQTFSSFALHINATRLYQDLRFSLRAATPAGGKVMAA